tara:strand:+ start:9234 stop:10031 length:798 start_codon:yes stop_codon:yes gene_type:complete
MGKRFDIREWKNLNESRFKTERMTEAEKKATLEAVSRFNEYGSKIYRSEGMAEMVEALKKLAENASKMAMEESADWFDSVSVKRDTKAIGEAVKVFEATAKEAHQLQQRMESVFEEIGGKLGKYYEIKELVEDEKKLDPVGKEDDDIDNDGDTDSSDEYLKKRRAAVSKAVKNENKFKTQVNEAFEGLQSVISTPGYAINMNPTNEAAPKIKNSKETELIKKLYVAASGLKKGGGSGRYGKEFDAAKKKMLKAFNDMLTYSKIGG